MRLLILLIMLSLPTFVLGKPAKIKSGEHSTFSRLVLYTGQTQQWTQSRKGNKVTIKVTGWTSSFDTADTFTFIPRERVTEIRALPDGIELTLDCTCKVQVAAVERGGIMVDITDTVDDVEVDVPPPDTRLVWPEPDGFVMQSATSASINALRKTLTQRLAKAATQDLLVPAPPSATRPAAAQQLFDEPHAVERIRTTSAAERANQRNAPSIPTPPQCPPEHYGDIQNWGTDESFADQLGRLRRDTVMEFDVTDQSSALHLTRLYLFFAMGAEARASIVAFDQDTYDANFLTVVSRLLDGESGRKISLDLPANGCEGTMSLWAALLGRTDAAISEPQGKIVAEAFSRLPHHLRTILGPKLISRLHDDENGVAAGVVKNMISNHTDADPQYPNPASNLADSSIPELEALVAQSNAETPMALVALINRTIDQNLAISNDILIVARSFARQQAGTPEAIQIEKALVRVSAFQGNYTDAIASAMELEADQDRKDLIGFTVSQIIAKGRDIDVAKFALNLGHDGAQTYLQQSAVQEIADRLTAAGMDELSRDFSGKKGSTKRDHPPQVNASTAPAGPARPRALPDEPTTIAAASAILKTSKDLREQVVSTLGPAPP
ncbi:hypothetical protein [Litoreibacter albidus]|uniref:hypothetical protein n=1 Tax=Litoreibacter albidus TaxID=670155 RepID=UPI0037370F81